MHGWEGRLGCAAVSLAPSRSGLAEAAQVVNCKETRGGGSAVKGLPPALRISIHHIVRWPLRPKAWGLLELEA